MCISTGWLGVCNFEQKHRLQWMCAVTAVAVAVGYGVYPPSLGYARGFVANKSKKMYKSQPGNIKIGRNCRDFEGDVLVSRRVSCVFFIFEVFMLKGYS